MADTSSAARARIIDLIFVYSMRHISGQCAPATIRAPDQHTPSFLVLPRECFGMVEVAGRGPKSTSPGRPSMPAQIFCVFKTRVFDRSGPAGDGVEVFKSAGASLLRWLVFGLLGARAAFRWREKVGKLVSPWPTREVARRICRQERRPQRSLLGRRPAVLLLSSNDQVFLAKCSELCRRAHPLGPLSTNLLPAAP